MKVLIACEYSGIMREAFAARGWDAWSCDLLSTDQPGQHIMDDVRNVLDFGWDLMIAHPPCTYLSYAANRYWNQPGRTIKREMGRQLFMSMYNAPIEHVCIENPTGYMNTVFRKPDQIIHPYFFGDKHLKRTCLWLRGLPKLWFWKEDDLFGKRTMTEYPEAVYATERADGSIKLRHFSEASHGGHVRSKSFEGIANAMAEQWTALLKPPSAIVVYKPPMKWALAV